MKKIFRLLLVISFGISMYTLFFWEPKEHEYYDLKEEAKETLNNNEEKNIDVDNVKLKESSAKSKSIFKVKEEVFKNNITEEDKDKIDKIINSMSEVDIDKIRREENNVDKEEGTRKKFKLLSKRLPSKDYKVIKDIYATYIDFAAI